jgi:hypothetical protein
MILKQPFIISARLLPALKIGNATLHLDNVTYGTENRDRAHFILDLPDGVEYKDDQLQSGQGGFSRTQDAFATFLCFLDAAAESYIYADNAYSTDSDANMSLFPENVVQWAAENADELQMLRCDIEETDALLIEE